MADSDVGKLFVGGISRDTTEATLTDHFSQYGVVSSSIIAKDRISGAPRGFAFVTFSDPSSVHKALLHHHLIAGRTVEVKKAIPRSEQPNIQKQQQQQQPPSQIHSETNKGWGRNTNGSYGTSNTNQHFRAKKIFVGGLSANLTQEEFRSYFEKFGRITDVVVMHDNNTNRPRGFGFITFDSEEVVEEIMQKSHHELAGKRVEVKRAVPREATKNSNIGNNSRFSGGRFSPVAGYPEDNYWPRGPITYGSYPGQVPLSTTYPGYYYGAGGYPFGGYGVFGYGMPLVPPRGPGYGFGVTAFPYGTGFYPTGVSGGVAVVGMVNPYNGVVESRANPKLDQDVVGDNSQLPAKDATRQMNRSRSDVDASSLKVDDQAQSKVPPPVSQSS